MAIVAELELRDRAELVTLDQGRAPTNSRREIAVACGDSWSKLTQLQFPEHELTRIKTYLGGMGPDDLVYTRWYGLIVSELAEGEIATRLVVVGQDGAGRQLRRSRYDADPADLLEDVSSIYFCIAPNDAAGLRYVVIDCAGDDMRLGRKPAPYLVCHRRDFVGIHAALGASQTAGQVWVGDDHMDAEDWLEINEADYVFPEQLVDELVAQTAGFISSVSAGELQKWGVPPRRGIILYGPPGNGKTVLSRIVAKRALISGVNVVSLPVHELEGDIGDSLKLAASRAPVVILIDDLDIHCGRRLREGEYGAPIVQRQRFLATLLEFLDGMEPTNGYVLLGTTNELKELDPALLRAGRFDVHQSVGKPDAEARRKVLTNALAYPGKDIVPGLDQAVEVTNDCSFAELAELARRYKIAVVRTHEEVTVDQELFNEISKDLADEVRANANLGGGPP